MVNVTCVQCGYVVEVPTEEVPDDPNSGYLCSAECFVEWVRASLDPPAETG